MRSADFGYGSGRSSVALTVLKIAVVAPTPIASVATAASGASSPEAFYGCRGKTNSPLGSRCRMASTFPSSTVKEMTWSGNSLTRNWCGRQG